MLTIVTPVSRNPGHFLRETATSVEKLAALHPQPLQWILSSDGPSPKEMGDAVGELDRVELTYLPPVDLPPSTVGRASLARNRAFPHVKYPWVAHLDDDDMVIPEGMALLLDRALTEDHTWVSGEMELLKNGQRESLQRPEAFVGPMEKGAFRSYLERHRLQPFSGGATLLRRTVLEEVGGWPALPYHQDTQLWLTITDSYGGLATDELIYVWRRHESQMTPAVLGTRPPMWR